jgi:hypothetical protein
MAARLGIPHAVVEGGAAETDTRCWWITSSIALSLSVQLKINHCKALTEQRSDRNCFLKSVLVSITFLGLIVNEDNAIERLPRLHIGSMVEMGSPGVYEHQRRSVDADEMTSAEASSS